MPRKQGILRLRMTTWNRVHDKCIADFTCLHARLYERQVDSHDCCCSRTILFVNFNEGDIFFSISDDIIFNAHVHGPLEDRVDVPVRPDVKCIFDSLIVPLSFSTSSIAEIDIEIEIPFLSVCRSIIHTCSQIF